MLTQSRLTHTSERASRPIYAESPQLKPLKKLLPESIWFSRSAKKEDPYQSMATNIQPQVGSYIVQGKIGQGAQGCIYRV